MSSQNPKLAMFEHLAAMARALGSPHRLELIELLAQTERSVEELARLTGLSIANASQHLQQLLTVIFSQSCCRHPIKPICTRRGRTHHTSRCGRS
jgi:predicted transcriptional regulator